MKSEMRKARAVILAACLVLIAQSDGAQTRAQEHPFGFRFEGETFFGTMIAGKEIARGVNATGGHEQLIARLDHGTASGVRIGMHNSVVGVDVNLLSALNPAKVKNEFAVAFPNHAERPLIYSGDVLVYPFRKAIKDGSIRPYLTSGIGGMFFLADLDNINDQERHNRPMWNAGGGAKVFLAGESAFYLDLRFTNHRLLGRGSQGATALRSVSIGFGYRF